LNVTCPYCHRPAKLVTGVDIYPHRPDLVRNLFWRCAPCGAYCGCHQKHPQFSPAGTTPLGRLANAELRREKRRAHEAFDPLWKSGEMPRTEAYQWLADQIGVSVVNCHIGMLDVDGCKAVVAAVKGLQRKAA